MRLLSLSVNGGHRIPLGLINGGIFFLDMQDSQSVLPYYYAQ